MGRRPVRGGGGGVCGAVEVSNSLHSPATLRALALCSSPSTCFSSPPSPPPPQARCYRYCKNKPYIRSRYLRGVPESKIKIFDVGLKKASVDKFPFCMHLVSNEREQITVSLWVWLRRCRGWWLRVACGASNA